MIAYDQLDPITRRNVLWGIRHHPRYVADFLALQPESVSRAEQDRWLFSQAAVWPDLARRFDHRPPRQRKSLVKRYHHGSWHYINLPLFISDLERTQLEPVPANYSRRWRPGGRISSLNAVQALLRTTRPYNGPFWITRGKHSESIPWQLHLVGDLHQPMHSTALFTVGAFPSGDRGGNCLRVGNSNLHALWDNAVSTTTDWVSLDREAGTLLEEYGEQGRTAASEVNIQRWLVESHALAASIAYHPEFLQTVAHARQPDEDCALTVSLPEGYVDEMTAVSRQRIVEAGYRLASWLQAVQRR